MRKFAAVFLVLWFALIPFAAFTRAQTAAPEGQVKAMYLAWHKWKNPRQEKAFYDKYFETKLAQLIALDQSAKAKGGSPVSGADILYDAQASDVKGSAVGEAGLDGSRITVPVSLTPQDASQAPRTVVFTMVESAGGWKVYDITYDLHDQPGQKRTLRTDLLKVYEQK